MLVAAGGGGGGGGSNYQSGTAGLAGGVATAAVNSNSRGANSTDNYATGGAGGGGYPFGGAAGASVSDDAGRPSGGYGGQNYANINVTSSTLIAGSGVTPGGLTNALYPKAKRGYNGYDGAIILVFQKLFTAWIKDTGVWESVTNAWVKVPDTIVTTRVERVGTPVTRTFTTPGISNWTVPADVTSVRLTYPTTDGLVITTQSVTPGQIISVTVGDYAQSSAFGATSIPGFTKQVFRYVGNIDHITDIDLSIATATGSPLTIGGYNAGQIAGAKAAGITYDVTYEGWHGDLYSELYFTPVPTSTVLTNINLTTGGGGRYGAPSVLTQPTRANPVASVRVAYDPGSGEGSYDSTLTLTQQGYIRLDYAPVVAPEYIITNTGGWKQINQGWIKIDGKWKSVATPTELNPIKSSSVPVDPVKINLVIAADTSEYDLSTYLDGAGYYPGRSIITLTVNSGVVVSSGSINTPAIWIRGLTTGDAVTLINNGTIRGRGGDGGAAGSYSTYVSYVNNNYYCFPAGTKITTADGTIDIENIVIGDVVLAFDIGDVLNYQADLNAKKVTAVYKHQWAGADVSPLIIITHEYGTLTTTPEHEILCSNKTDTLSDYAGFVTAGQLTPGDTIFTGTGLESKVISVTSGPDYDYVYNFEVEEYHTYIADDVRVHNGFNSYAPKGGYRVGVTQVNSTPGRPGNPGGVALAVEYTTTLVNNSTIAGGGGGGGGGGGPTGGQGGGGGGYGQGANNGSSTAGGAGAGLGGAGGALGQTGVNGTNETNIGGTGGAAGPAIIGYTNISITTEGTIIGTRT
jgi:hypothetical protein